MKKIIYESGVIQAVIGTLDKIGVQGLRNMELMTIAGKLLREQGQEADDGKPGPGNTGEEDGNGSKYC